MKITLCGSIAFHDKMIDIQKELKKLGHEVRLPPFEIQDDQGNWISVKEYYTLRKNETSETAWIWDKKAEAMQNHFKKIEWCDVILVLNYDKNDIPYYIGANTLLEMGLAFYLSKKIFLFNPIPEISYKEEILGMKPHVIHHNIENIA